MDRQRRGDPIGHARRDRAGALPLVDGAQADLLQLHPGQQGAGPVVHLRLPLRFGAPRSSGSPISSSAALAPALGLGQARGQGQHHLPVTRGGTGQADTLGGKVVLRGQVAGGEELLEGAMGEG